MHGGPTKCLHQKDADEGSDAVDADVFDGRTAVGNEGLVVFIQTGKAYADKAGKEHEPESPDLVYIKRKGDGNGKKKIFRHVCGLSYIILDAVGFRAKFIVILSKIQYLVLCFHDLIADFIA